jgi:Ricin-type beta-trefoil lectin domain/NedA-like, galactose-binding domain
LWPHRLRRGSDRGEPTREDGGLEAGADAAFDVEAARNLDAGADRSLDAGAERGLDDRTGTDSSTLVPGQVYELIGQGSGKCLDVPLSSTNDGATLDILTCTGGSNQLFRWDAIAGGAYALVNVNSGKCLGFADTMVNTPLSQSACSGSLNQAFAAINVMGSYFLLVVGGSGMCIDVAANVKVDGTIVLQYPRDGTSAQNFDFVPVATSLCTPESDAAFCARLGAKCGTRAGTDNCGVSRTVGNCGPCVPLQQSCAIAAANACGTIGKTNLAQGGTVSASAPGSSINVMTKAFDGDASTKWYLGGSSTPWIAYRFGGATSHVVTSYSVTSGDDWTDRDPTAWELQGSNDGTNWTTLDTRTGQRFENRAQTNYYAFSNANSYNGYRFYVTANNGSVDFQVAEIELFP